MTRRVVTGHSPDGKAVVASDEDVEPIRVDLAPGYEFLNLWGADEAPSYPDAGSPLAAQGYFPPVGGFRVGLFTVAPDSTAMPEDLDLGAAVEQMQRLLPGMADHMEPDAPGMHTTATVDVEYVISGQCELELDDGVKVQLKAGDSVVQSGTRHAWRNPYDEPCQMVVVLVGAHRT